MSQPNSQPTIRSAKLFTISIGISSAITKSNSAKFIMKIFEGVRNIFDLQWIYQDWLLIIIACYLREAFNWMRMKNEFRNFVIRNIVVIDDLLARVSLF